MKLGIERPYQFLWVLVIKASGLCRQTGNQLRTQLVESRAIQPICRWSTSEEKENKKWFKSGRRISDKLKKISTKFQMCWYTTKHWVELNNQPINFEIFLQSQSRRLRLRNINSCFEVCRRSGQKEKLRSTQGLGRGEVLKTYARRRRSFIFQVDVFKIFELGGAGANFINYSLSGHR